MDREVEAFWTGDQSSLNNIYGLLRRRPEDGGDLLLATEGGLCRADALVPGDVDGVLEGRIVLEDRPGMPQVSGRAVYFVVEGAQGRRIGIGTERGADLWEGGTQRTYGLFDGMLGAETNRGAGLVEEDGTFWVGTDSGLSRLAPGRERRPGLPPTVELHAVDDGTHRVVDGGGGGPVPIHRRSVELKLRAIGFSDEASLRFRYRLAGVDDGWRGPEALPRRIVRYTNLQPGTYHFHFEAIDRSGARSGVVVSPPLEVHGPLWSRPWFRLVLALASAAVLWLLVSTWTRRRYLRRLEHEVQVQTAALALSEERMAADRERLAVTVHSVADGLVATDSQGRITLWNDAAACMTGRSAEQVMGSLPAEGLGLDADGRSAIEAALAGTTPRMASISTAGGVQLTVELSASRLGSGAAGMVIAFRDVTERLAMERELAKVQRLESLGLVAGGIAHDFNNHLTVIMGALSMLSETADRPARERIWLAEQACDQTRALTRQLVTFARGGAPVRRPTALPGVVEKVASGLLDDSAIRCSVAAPSHLWPANVDAAQIEDVVAGLVQNARDAIGEGDGEVRIAFQNHVEAPSHDGGAAVGPELTDGASVSQRFVELTVEDTGPGIAPEDRHRVFDPFFSTRRGGMGLGLAVAHSVVRRHDGRIDVESGLGEGARFRILLPASDEPAIESSTAV